MNIQDSCTTSDKQDVKRGLVYKTVNSWVKLRLFDILTNPRGSGEINYAVHRMVVHIYTLMM